tara:strand:- start:2656 stop:3189 length:534 start_codon:yes stop_codon:yes gene_type:complete
MSLTLIQSQTASTDTTVSFTTKIDSTYKTYLFKCVKIHPSADGESFSFQANVSGASGYNETITSSYFRTYHTEDDSSATTEDQGAFDQAQGTAFQPISPGISNDNDACGDGELWLFNPSGTTFIKHFYATFEHLGNVAMRNSFTEGYFNVTGAITEIQFKMSSGTFDGVISLYGMGE